MRESRLKERKLQVRVCNKTNNDTSDEKLLGITMSNDMTWKTFLHGIKESGKVKEIGLFKKLSQRIGMQLIRFMSSNQLKKI